ncbi:MAG TPA: carbonic anhydrase, partial [Bacteroidia bacterium]|nr:carbonic anhydrase [Bacteroidia bacterium]
VQKAYKQRNLQVHGWVFDMQTGKLIDLKIDLPKELKDIMEIYDLG